MSLTNFTEWAKQEMDELAPIPQVALKGELRAIPLTTNYATVGTAFDYVMRVWLEKINSGKTVSRTQLVAESSIECPWCPPPQKRKMRAFMKEYEQHQQQYQSGKSNLDNALLSDCLILANMDAIYRTGTSIPDEKIFSYNKDDVEDLNNLVNLLNAKKFTVNKRCLLNPIFGASTDVGGADADLILDDTLIDIKTTKYLRLDPKHWRQIIGYALLDRMERPHGINQVGIYFSRHGLLWLTEIPNIDRHTQGKFEKLVQEYGEELGE